MNDRTTWSPTSKSVTPSPSLDDDAGALVTAEDREAAIGIPPVIR
jgi:hypothetical protein